MLVSDAIFKIYVNRSLEVGESPVWDDARKLLWFVDITRPSIYSLDPISGDLASFPMPCAVGSIGMAQGGFLIAALRSGIHLFDPSTGGLDFLVHPEPEMTMNRLNDGKVGPDGCFWVGSMHDSVPRAPSGSLYRIAPNGDCTRMIDGIRVSNGLAWSPDGRTMYHSDSRGPHVRAYDFDLETGSLSNGRTIATLTEAMGLPDGAAVDMDGCYWSAGVSAGRLNRLRPDGSAMEPMPVPVPAPTMPCFGGADMKTLFVTSLAVGGPEDRVMGSVIGCRVGVAGTPVGRFGAPRKTAARFSR